MNACDAKRPCPRQHGQEDGIRSIGPDDAAKSAAWANSSARIAGRWPNLPGSPTDPVSRASLIDHAASALRMAGIENPRLEARLLLAHALGIRPAELICDPFLPADPAAVEHLVARRVAHEPLAHILGHREFWSLDFLVSPATLIPRPDSETVVEAAVAAFAGRSPPERILDLGTGTGCLLLAVLHEFQDSVGVGVDCSPDATGLAAANAAALGFAHRSAFVCGDWAAAVRARFDLVLCNPPYVPTSEIGGLMPEVARYEPVRALDGGRDGLAAYRRVLSVLPELLSNNGVAVLELGIGQSAAVATLARHCGMAATTRPDLAGTPRAMVLTRTTG